jgi:hypothetical protein
MEVEVKVTSVPWQTVVETVEIEILAVIEGETVTARQVGALL